MYDELTVVAGALAAFAQDLGSTGLAGVTLVTLSEFGRRVAENGSGGVDHGHGNAVLLLGGGVVGGQVHGPWPGLGEADLDQGDVRGVTDYRSVLAEVLASRCGAASLSTVFPGLSPARAWNRAAPQLRATSSGRRGRRMQLDARRLEALLDPGP